MTQLISATMLIAMMATAHADETRYCNGFLTTNNVCIGSQSNTAPPIIDCTYDSSDSRCRSRR
jgi:hypothetical protein